jgi:hypothetical protein
MSSIFAPTKLTFPPVGMASISPHLKHFISTEDLLKIICLFSHFLQATLKNFDSGKLTNFFKLSPTQTFLPSSPYF